MNDSAATEDYSEQSVLSLIDQLHSLSVSLTKNTPALLRRAVKESLSSVEEQILRKACLDAFGAGFINEERARSINYLLNTPAIQSWRGYDGTVVESLVSMSYKWMFAERFPELFASATPMLQVEFTKNAGFTQRRIYALLASMGHEWFTERPACLAKISKPAQTGYENKGRTPEVPQEDWIGLIYNAEEVLRVIETNEKAGPNRDRISLPNAWVSLDGISLKSITLEHNRVKVISKPALVNKYLSHGWYDRGSALLPIHSIRPFWQQSFIEMMSNIIGTNQLGSLAEEIERKYNITPAVVELFFASASRFLGDQLTPEEYMQQLREVPEFKCIFDSAPVQTGLFGPLRGYGEYEQARQLLGLVAADSSTPVVSQ